MRACEQGFCEFGDCSDRSNKPAGSDEYPVQPEGFSERLFATDGWENVGCRGMAAAGHLPPF